MTDEVVDRLIVQVRADTRTFGGDIKAIEGMLDGQLTQGVERASKRMESALSRFFQTGKFGFDDLRKVALQVLADIASAQLRTAVSQIGGGSGGSGGGLLSGLLSLATTVFSSAGRASGGPVAAGRPYRVGELGPELFVPGQAGQIVPARQTRGNDRAVSITINMAPGEGSDRIFMRRSGSQIARAVRQALEQTERDV